MHNWILQRIESLQFSLTFLWLKFPGLLYYKLVYISIIGTFFQNSSYSDILVCTFFIKSSLLFLVRIMIVCSFSCFSPPSHQLICNLLPNHPLWLPSPRTWTSASVVLGHIHKLSWENVGCAPPTISSYVMRRPSRYRAKLNREAHLHGRSAVWTYCGPDQPSLVHTSTPSVAHVSAL